MTADCGIRLRIVWISRKYDQMYRSFFQKQYYRHNTSNHYFFRIHGWDLKCTLLSRINSKMTADCGIRLRIVWISRKYDQMYRSFFQNNITGIILQIIIFLEYITMIWNARCSVRLSRKWLRIAAFDLE